MPFPAPPLPHVADDQRATSTGSLRYEDLTQDGRMMPWAVPHALGGVWRALFARHRSAGQSQMAGVLPILTRITIATTEQPVRVDSPTEARGAFQVAHGLDAAGAVHRIYLNMWCDVLGTSGRMFPPLPAGPLAPAAHMFTEHVFTRLFAPPDQRRVTRLDLPGMPEVPPDRHDAQPPTTAMDAPPGARWLDELAVDPSEMCFTLDQTDANQHINSLVYLHVFRDAVQRRLAATDRSLRVRVHAVDIAYRKPCFAGDRARVSLRLFEGGAGGDGLGAAGYVTVAGDDKPRCYVRMLVAP